MRSRRFQRMVMLRMVGLKMSQKQTSAGEEA
jgi:hypothetical protein